MIFEKTLFFAFFLPVGPDKGGRHPVISLGDYLELAFFGKQCLKELLSHDKIRKKEVSMMKKVTVFIILILAAVGAILAGYLLYPVLPFGDPESSSDSQESTIAAPETEEVQVPVLTVTAKGESVQPYAYWSYGMDWSENGFLCSDAPPLENELPQLVKEGMIPELVYADDITVTSEAGDENIKTYHLYDENYRQLEPLEKLSDIAKLDPGKYYAAIPVHVEGDYIAQAEEHEYSGYEYVFCLIVE